MIFYKGILESDLKINLIPGTVTADFNEAYMWYERINSKKNYGASRHIKHGKAVIISFEVDENLILSPEHFQQVGVHEHEVETCWTSNEHVKAQINFPINNYDILCDLDISHKLLAGW